MACILRHWATPVRVRTHPKSMEDFSGTRKNIEEVAKGENPSFIYDPSGYFTRIRRPDPDVRSDRPYFVIIPSRQTIAPLTATGDSFLRDNNPGNPRERPDPKLDYASERLL